MLPLPDQDRRTHQLFVEFPLLYLLTFRLPKVWDLNGPHLEKISMQGQQDDMVVTAQTHEEGISIAVAEGVLASYPAEMKQIVKNHKILHRIFFITMPGETYTTDKWITVFTGKDVVNPREEALHLLQQSRTEGYRDVQWITVQWITKKSFKNVEIYSIIMSCFN